jgi:hypothetical protein
MIVYQAYLDSGPFSEEESAWLTSIYLDASYNEMDISLGSELLDRLVLSLVDHKPVATQLLRMYNTTTFRSTIRQLISPILVPIVTGTLRLHYQ